jgi:hypothetical protein
MKTAPEGLSWAAAGECLLRLTRQPLRRPGQPKAAAPDSCIRVASAPGERSYIYGKPMPETGQLYFRGIPRCRCPGGGARAVTPGDRRVRALSVRRGLRAAGPSCGGAFMRRGLRAAGPSCGGPLGAAGLGVGRLHLVGRVPLPGRPRRKTGFCHSGTGRTETYDVDAAFMLLGGVSQDFRKRSAWRG